MGHKKSRCIKETHQCGTIFLSDRLGSEAFSLRSVASLWYTVMQSEEKEEYIPMVDELRHAFELAQQQPEGMQRYIAELITHELSSEEVVVTPELAAELATAQAEIAAGDVREYEAYRRERRKRKQQ